MRLSLKVIRTNPSRSKVFAMLTDVHIHLQFFKSDSDNVLKRARAVGVSRFFCASASPEDWNAVLKAAESDESIVPFLGTHPQYAALHDPERLKSLLLRCARAKVGEIGLDARYPAQDQKEVFLAQLDAATELERPCVIHCVKAFDALCPMLKKRSLPPALLFHSFSGSLSEIPFLAERGGYFSFSGAAVYPNRHKAHALIRAVPAERLLIETDAPDMMPPPDCRADPAAERNLPENLPLIIRKIAAIKEIEECKFRQIITKNAARFEQGCL